MSPSDCPSRLRELSPARRDCVLLIQSIHFGSIEGLVLRNGEPILDPEPKTVYEIKLGADTATRSELTAGNFLLKAQVVELLQYFDRIDTGTVPVIEIRHGLPFRVLLHKAVA